MSQDTIDSLEAQLHALYQERELLNDRFGVSSTDEIIGMVDCLEAQLRDFYSRFGGIDGMSNAEAAVMVDQIRSLGGMLDDIYTHKSVEFTIVDDKPVLRAQWNDITSNGDSQ